MYIRWSPLNWNGCELISFIQPQCTSQAAFQKGRYTICSPFSNINLPVRRNLFAYCRKGWTQKLSWPLLIIDWFYLIFFYKGKQHGQASDLQFRVIGADDYKAPTQRYSRWTWFDYCIPGWTILRSLDPALLQVHPWTHWRRVPGLCLYS